MTSFLIVNITTGQAVVECLGFFCLKLAMQGRPPTFVAAECHSGMSLTSWDWERFAVGMELLKLRFIMDEINHLPLTVHSKG